MDFKQQLTSFLRDEQALTTVEYAIGGALVGLGVVTAFTNLGTAIADAVQGIIDAITLS